MNGQDFMIFMGILAGVISLLAYVPYIASIIRRKTVPSRTSFWILFFVGLITLLAYKESGASNTLFFLIGDLVGCFLIALLSLLYGKDGTQTFDKLCFFGAIVSLGLWFFFQEHPSVALISSLSVEFVAMIPILKKAYLNPFEEDITAWLLSFVAAVMNIYAIETWSFLVALIPIYELVIVGTIVLFLSRRGESRVPLKGITSHLKMVRLVRFKI